LDVVEASILSEPERRYFFLFLNLTGDVITRGNLQYFVDNTIVID